VDGDRPEALVVDEVRHEVGVAFRSQGLPMHFVSRNLGHHSPSFTAALYATAQPDPHLDED
jgi:hypothetical protein